MPDTNRLTTTLGRAWKVKTAIFALAFLALGIWGAWDALVVYPKRGRTHADFALQDYLESAGKQSEGEGPFTFRKNASELSVADPPGELERLTRLKNDSVLGQPGNQVEASRFVWLESLSRITSLGRLKAENDAELQRRADNPTSAPEPTRTLFVDLYERYNEIKDKNRGRNRPSPLNALDIPLQYLFMIAGFAGFIYMILFFVRVGRKSFAYDPEAKRLTLPDGRSITPDELETVDKRKWDKYLVFLTLKDGSPEIRLDLYRYDPLETWILEMEKLAPGYEPIAEEGEAILCVDVLSGAPLRLIPGVDTTLPASNDAGKPAIYPAVRTVAGPWFVVGANLRARLREGVEKGALSDPKVDLESFRVDVAEHDPENISERDLRPAEEIEEELEEEAAAAEKLEEDLLSDDSLNA